MQLTAHGLQIDLPSGWEGRIFQNPALPGDTTAPALHIANFPLPLDDSEFGSGSTANMKSGHVFVAVVEYIPSGEFQPGQGKFAARGRPSAAFATTDFAPSRLQVGYPNQAGLQRFFSV